MKWSRGLITGVGFILIAIAVAVYLSGGSNGAGPMLFTGAVLFVIGPVLDRLTSIKFGLDGAEATLAAADRQVSEGKVKEVRMALEGGTAWSAQLEPVSRPDVARIVIADSAAHALIQLGADDKADVESTVEEMQALHDGGGVQLPGSTRYWVREVNARIRLVYRALDRTTAEDPRGYAVLNIVKPGSALWKLTERAL